jgi:hypothetical protein
MSLPQLEVDADFDDDIDWRTATSGRREAPLTHGGDRLLIETAIESAKHLHVTDRSVTPDDDLEHDFAFDAAPPRVVGVARLDFTEKSRRLDPGTGAERPTAFAASGTRADAGSGAFTDTAAATRAGAAATARSLVGDRRFWSRRRFAPGVDRIGFGTTGA